MKTIRCIKKLIVSALPVLFFSCNKDESIVNNEAATQNLPGTIYFHFAGKYGLLDFKTNRYVKEYATQGRIGKIHISYNGKNALVVVDDFSRFGNDGQIYRL